jgi:hypothetical protein
MIRRLFFVIPGCFALCFAKEAPAPPPKSEPKDAVAAPPVPTVTKLDGARFQVGKVICDKKKREIRFPAEVNMTEGALEYVIVHNDGKVHEALVRTLVTHADLKLALTTLNFKPSREIFSERNAKGEYTNVYPIVPADVKAAARISIHLEWDEKGTARKISLNECLQAEAEESPKMAAGPWLYSGNNGACKDLATLHLDDNSLISYTAYHDLKKAHWFPVPKILPAVGTSLTVVITPFTKARSQ